MVNIIWYEIATGKVISSIMTVNGTEEDTRPAYDIDNETKTLAYAQVMIDESKTHLATYDATNQTVNYAEQTPVSLETQVRSIRNARLANSDWTQANDSPLDATKKTEWASYRQTLRDLPNNLGDATTLDEVNFPTKPE